MTTSAVLLRWCATCLAESLFEQPECLDDHEGECSEWFCVGCGDALLLGFAVPEVADQAAARAIPSRVA